MLLTCCKWGELSTVLHSNVERFEKCMVGVGWFGSHNATKLGGD